MYILKQEVVLGSYKSDEEARKELEKIVKKAVNDGNQILKTGLGYVIDGLEVKISFISD